MLHTTIGSAKDIIKKSTQAWLYGNHSIPPIMMWGTYGIGKSSIIESVATELGIESRVINVADRLPQDLRGLPDIEESKDGIRLAIYASPKEIPQSGKGILFFDELNMSSPTMMAIAQRLLLDRSIGETKIGEDWYIVAAGNRAEDRAAVFEMPNPTKNRMSHITVESNLSEWKSHFLDNELDGYPLDPRILGYLNFASHDFHPNDGGSSEYAQPTPRTWGKLNAYLAADMEFMAPAIIGEGVGNAFLSFLEVSKDLPDIEAILRGDEVAPVNAKKQNVSVLYSAVSSIAMKCVTEDLPKGISPAVGATNAMKWVLTNETKPMEFFILLITEVCRSIKFKKNHAAEFVGIALKDPVLKAEAQKIREYTK